MKKSVLAFVFIASLVACSKTDNPEPPMPMPMPAVYAVGHDNFTAKFWKNDSLSNLTDGTVYSEATDMAFSGKDLYIVGREGSVLKYWKNGIAASLTDGSYPVYPFGIAVKGNDIYIAGDFTPPNDAAPAAAYWKNAVRTRLTTGLNGSSYAWGIAISDSGDIYIAGSEGLAAKYWKNSVATSLTDGTTPASATAITISKNTIYIGGIENGVVKYWKNGIATNVSGAPDPDRSYSISSIFVDKTDVYLGGQIRSTSIADVNKIYTVAAYWKNSMVTELTGRKAPAGLVSSIAVYGSDVYAAGNQFDQVNSRNVARYWKNGVPVSLTDSSRAVAGLSKIIVK